MKKYKIKSTGEPVAEGDTIEKTIKKETSFGSYCSIETILITKDIIPTLLKEGVLVEDTPQTEQIAEDLLLKVIHKIGKKLDLSEHEVVIILDSLNKSYKVAVLNILMKELSMILNKNKKFGEIAYAISLINGNIIPVNTPKQGYTTLFTCEEDAILAKNTLSAQFDLMYGKQKD